MNSKALVVVAVSLVCAGASVAILFCLIQPVTHSVNEATPSNDKWAIYESLKYGYKVSYPSHWGIVEDGNSTTFDSPKNKRLMSEKMEQDKTGESYQSNIAIIYYPSLATEPDNSGPLLNALTLEDFVYKSPTISNVTPITIDGQQAFRAIRRALRDEDTIFVESSGHLYEIVIGSRVGISAEIEKQFLSSLQFIKQEGLSR
jgi:hypothetical protein